MSVFARAVQNATQQYSTSRVIGLAVGGVSAVAGLSYAINPPMHAQGRKEKLGIYDEPVETNVDQSAAPSRLQILLSDARETATNVTHDATTQGKHFVDKVIDAEKQVERTVRKVHASDEPMMPNLLYIGLAGLAGSILASRRTFLARLLYPTAAAVGAAWYFMPKTTQSTFGLLRETADSPEIRDTVRRHAPAVLDGSDKARETVAQSVNQVGQLRQNLERTVSTGVARARQEMDGMEHRVRSSLGGVSEDASQRAGELTEELKKKADEARQQGDHVSGWLRARGEEVKEKLPAAEKAAEKAANEANDQVRAKTEALRERVEATLEDAQHALDDAVKQIHEQGNDAANWVQVKVEQGREKAQQVVDQGREKLGKAEHSLRSDDASRRPS
ncbi:apolipo protein O-domain-containing protein [Syncephalis plumigaleata]|nr:apolipo protein O-domain-containing protein [Syncephalis plumigaleata]